MIAEDGTVIVATAKEKEDARREYEAAIRQGAMAGLVEHVADDGELPSLLSLCRCSTTSQSSQYLWVRSLDHSS